MRFQRQPAMKLGIFFDCFTVPRLVLPAINVGNIKALSFLFASFSTMALF